MLCLKTQLPPVLIMKSGSSGMKEVQQESTILCDPIKSFKDRTHSSPAGKKTMAIMNNVFPHVCQ